MIILFRTFIAEQMVLILFITNSCECYVGFVNVDGEAVKVCVELTPSGQANHDSAECSSYGVVEKLRILADEKCTNHPNWSLVHDEISREVNAVQAAYRNSDDGHGRNAMHFDWPIILDKAFSHLSSTSSTTNALSGDAFDQVLRLLEAVGEEAFAYASSDLSEVHLVARDTSDRSHLLNLKLPPGFPACPPACGVDLPEAFLPAWTSVTNSEEPLLVNVYNEFCRTLDVYDEFWNQMAMLDAEVVVLEPAEFSFAATYRRLAVNTACSIRITVDPRNPRDIPRLQFLGPDVKVAELQKSRDANYASWSEDASLLENLRMLFGVSFMRRTNDLPLPINGSSLKPANGDAMSTSGQRELEDVCCAICYMHQLADKLPSENCPGCSRPFHYDCLFNWIRKNSTRQRITTSAFGMAGNCPNCGKAIKLKIQRH